MASPCGPGALDLPSIRNTGVVRSAGLPVSLLAELSFTRLDSLVTRIVEAEEWLDSEGRWLADALYEPIGLPNLTAQERRGLVNLRRALFTSRDVKDGQGLPAAAHHVSAEIVTRVEHWLAHRRLVSALHQELDQTLEAEFAERAETLRRVASRHPFPHAISMASADMYEELQRWLARPDRRPKKQKLSRLATYVVRAATKTSPFSFFTSSSLARWAEGKVPLRLDTDGVPRAVLEVDAEYLGDLARSLTGREDLAEALPLRLNPSAVWTESGVEFLGRPSREVIARVAGTAAVREVMRLLGNRPTTSRPELERMLAGAADRGTDEAGRYIDRLVDAGLVEAQLPVPDCAPDWLGDCGSWLRAQRSGELRDIGMMLIAASAALRRNLPAVEVGRHRERCAEVRQRLQTVMVAAGEVGRPPVLFENAVSDAAAELGEQWWQPVLSDLDVIRPWLGAFDPQLPKRLAVSALHAERFGAGSVVPLLALYRTVMEAARFGDPTHGSAQAAVAELFGAGEPWAVQDAMLAIRGHGGPAFEELAALRERARSVLDGSADADGVVRIDPALLTEQVRHWPSWLETPSSVAFYVQLRAPDTVDEVVLNAAHGGHGRATARLRHLLGMTEGRPGPTDHAGAVVAGLAGRHGSTLNVYAPSTSSEIAYPFTTGIGTGSDDLRLADLMAAHDPATGTVRIQRGTDGRRVLPAHLGLMMAEYLPPAARFVVQIFGTDWLFHPAGLTFVPFDELVTRTDPVIAYPRVAVGRVVLRRAGWLMAAEQVPRRRPSEPDARFLLRLVRWFRTQGIPKRCFVRAWRGQQSGSGRLTRAQVRSRSAKPLFLDLANWFLVPPFERAVADASLVLIEEQLPTAEDGLERGPERFTTEVVLELPAGDDHG